MNDVRTSSPLGRHRSAAVIGVLTLLLGFAIAVQVRANSSSDALSGLRDDDLISILDNQNDRADRLRQQLADLQQNLAQLRSSGDSSLAARKQAVEQAQALGVLLGTLPATGPGVEVTVTDPKAALDGETLLAIVQELRGAGAEAIQVGSVRVSTQTAFTGSDTGTGSGSGSGSGSGGGSGGGSGVSVDGAALRPPYRILAIGDAKTLDTALNIPGGVAATVRSDGGELSVAERSTVAITATRALPRTTYAKPAR